MQLGFLEIGIDPQLVKRNDRHQRRAWLNPLAQLHGALGHITGDRRNQGGTGIGQVRLAQLRRCSLHIRVVGHRGVIDQRQGGVEFLLGIAQGALRR